MRLERDPKDDGDGSARQRQTTRAGQPDVRSHGPLRPRSRSSGGESAADARVRPRSWSDAGGDKEDGIAGLHL